MRALPALTLILGLSLVGCPKTEGDPGAVDSSPASPDPSTRPSAPANAAALPTATASASAAPSASASAPAAATTATPSPRPGGAAPSRTGATATAAAPAVDAGPTCGTKPLPDCPLQAWMKANTAVASASGVLPALAAALDKIATMGPSGYPNWSSISKDGATAARGGSLDAARASCTGCHKQYRDKYRAESRSRPVP